MQVSTRTHDFVVDCLSLRAALGPALCDIMADATVEKVLHGADSDVMWMQVGGVGVGIQSSKEGVCALCMLL